MNHPLAISDVAQSSAHDETELDPAELEIEFAEVMQFTREIFGGEVRIEVDPDPEIPGLTHIFFCVASTGNSQTMVARHLDWHRRIDRLALRLQPGLHLGLLVEPRE